MKTLITTIIIIFTIFIFIVSVKSYLAHPTITPKSKPEVISTTSSFNTLTTNHLSSTHAVATISHSKPVQIAINPTMQIAHDVKYKNASVTDINVNKLVSVASNNGLNPKALKSALNAYSWALHNGKLGSNKDILTVVDFTLPSYEKRMWVLSLHQNKVLMKLHTTQGAGSGLVYANRFSNTSRTQASSLGLYVTSEEYYGGHGKSMRLDGLQKGINNNARKRNIVIHEAPYASPGYIMANRRAGRSWGCFAISPSSKNALLSYVRGGSALFAYAHSIEKTPIVSNGPIAI